MRRPAGATSRPWCRWAGEAWEEGSGGRGQEEHAASSGVLSTDPSFTGVDGTAGGEEETGSGELSWRRCEKGRWRQRRRRRLEQWRQGARVCQPI